MCCSVGGKWNQVGAATSPSRIPCVFLATRCYKTPQGNTGQDKHVGTEHCVFGQAERWDTKNGNRGGQEAGREYLSKIQVVSIITHH